MVLRANRYSTDLWGSSPAGVLEYELAQETASALGRQGRALETALTALAAFDAAPRDPASPDARGARGALVVVAAQALWRFIVQRESCGLRDGGAVVRMYRVPAEVQWQMGAFPPPQP